MRRKFLWSGVCLVALGALFPAAGSAADPVTPGGMAYVWLTWPPVPTQGSDSFDITLRIIHDPGPRSAYFWAHQFRFVDGDGGYIGLQTNGYMQGRWVGKMAIFSIWNATAAIPGPRAECERFSGEGRGWSCRMRYPWKEGHSYRLRLWMCGNCVGETDPAWDWLGAWILDETTGEEVNLGFIRVPSSWHWLALTSCVWVEYYGQVESCDAIPYAVAEFSRPAIEGDPVDLLALSPDYGETCHNARIEAVGPEDARIVFRTGGAALATDHLTNPRTYRATYSVTITNLTARMDTLEIWIPRPIEWDSQKEVRIEGVTPSPTRTYTDPLYGNGIYYWRFRNRPRRGQSLTVSETFTFTAYDIVYRIDPDSIGPYDVRSQLYRTYTRSERFIEANDPAIRARAREIVGDEVNPYRKARLIYDWVIDHLRYRSIEGLGGAKFALERGYGECGDYAALFCALLRAVGVPARPVVGFWAESGRPTHVWAEFYLPGYGWVPADPERGDNDGEHGRDYYFARLDGSRRLIFSKGFNIRLSSEHTADLFQTYYWWWHGLAGKTRDTFYLTVEPVG